MSLEALDLQADVYLVKDVFLLSTDIPDFGNLAYLAMLHKSHIPNKKTDLTGFKKPSRSH
jgi:hypothetical protein